MPNFPLGMEPVEITHIVNGNPRLVYFGSDRQAYELDQAKFPTDPRERALLDGLLAYIQEGFERSAPASETLKTILNGRI